MSATWLRHLSWRAAIDLPRERLGTPDAKAIPGFRDRLREGAGLGTPA